MDTQVSDVFLSTRNQQKQAPGYRTTQVSWAGFQRSVSIGRNKITLNLCSAKETQPQLSVR